MLSSHDGREINDLPRVNEIRVCNLIGLGHGLYPIEKTGEAKVRALLELRTFFKGLPS